MENESLKTLKNIERMIAELKVKSDTEDMLKDSEKIIEKAELREEYSVQQIQSSFDRIHDKAFNFNNITLGAFLVLGTFPEDKPLIPLWIIVFPLIILVFIIYIDWRQMEIHRFASRETSWSSAQRAEYGNKIAKQTRLSLLMLFFSAACLIALFVILVS